MAENGVHINFGPECVVRFERRTSDQSVLLQIVDLKLKKASPDKSDQLFVFPPDLWRQVERALQIAK